jgi:hypothetical protein
MLPRCLRPCATAQQWRCDKNHDIKIRCQRELDLGIVNKELINHPDVRVAKVKDMGTFVRYPSPYLLYFDAKNKDMRDATRMRMMSGVQLIGRSVEIVVHSPRQYPVRSLRSGNCEPHLLNRSFSVNNTQYAVARDFRRIAQLRLYYSGTGPLVVPSLEKLECGGHVIIKSAPIEFVPSYVKVTDLVELGYITPTRLRRVRQR